MAVSRLLPAAALSRGGSGTLAGAGAAAAWLGCMPPGAPMSLAEAPATRSRLRTASETSK